MTAQARRTIKREPLPQMSGHVHDKYKLWQHPKKAFPCLLRCYSRCRTIATGTATFTRGIATLAWTVGCTWPFAVCCVARDEHGICQTATQPGLVAWAIVVGAWAGSRTIIVAISKMPSNYPLGLLRAVASFYAAGKGYERNATIDATGSEV